MKWMVTILLLIGVLSLSVQSQIQITATNSPVTVDFTGYTGSGFTPSPAAGQLDSDAWATTGMSDGSLAFGGTATTGDHARGTTTGGIVTGGFYALNAGGGNARFMIQPGGTDWTPGTITLRIQNSTGTTLTQIQVDYDIYINNNEARANSFNFLHSSDNSSYTSIPSLNYTSPEASDLNGFVLAGSRSTGIISGLSISNGSFYYLRWEGDDISGSGNRDEFAIDDIVVSGGSDDDPLPVELSSFTAAAGNGVVTLRWVTQSEINNERFDVLRAQERNGVYQVIGSRPGQGNSNAPTSYSFADNLVANGTTYWYKIADVDVNGVRTEHGPVSATPQAAGTEIITLNSDAPANFKIYPAYPNPFNPSTNLKFDIPAGSQGLQDVKVEIYNTIGQKIRTLFEGIAEPATHSLAWDGADDNGQIVPGGVYFAVLTTGHFRESVKLTLVK